MTLDLERWLSSAIVINADYIRVALNRLFRELNLAIDYTINYDQISARLLASYRLSVVLRDGMIWPHGCLEPNDYEYSHALENSSDWPKEQFEPWITEEQGAAIKDFVELVAHCCTSCTTAVTFRSFPRTTAR